MGAAVSFHHVGLGGDRLGSTGLVTPAEYSHWPRPVSHMLDLDNPWGLCVLLHDTAVVLK